MLKEIRLLPRVKSGAPGFPPRQLVLECDGCHVTFERLYTTELFKKERHFCGSDCWYRHSRGPAGSRGGELVTQPCGQCGTSVTRLKSQLDGKTNLFCEKGCWRLWKAANTPPERAASMATPEARAKSKASLIAQRSAPDYVHSWTDRHHTEESRAKMRASGVGKHSGAKNGMYERGHTEASREKMSEAHSRNIVEGRAYVYGGSKHKSGWHTSSKGNGGQPMFYHSSWEEALMRRLDDDENVASYQFERVRIPYYYNNNKRHYVPDFLVAYADGHRAMYEIKPKQFLDNEKTRLKAEAARAYCDANDVRDYEILTGEALRERGIIA